MTKMNLENPQDIFTCHLLAVQDLVQLVQELRMQISIER